MAVVFYMEIVTGSSCRERPGEAGHACRQAQLPPACGVGSSRVDLEAAPQHLGGRGWDVRVGPDSDPSPWWALTPQSLRSGLRHLVLPQPILCPRRGAWVLPGGGL